MMKLKKTRLQRAWQLIVLVTCIGGLITILEFSADLGMRNHQMLNEQTQSLSRLVVRQAAETAAPDVLNKDHEKLQALIRRLSQEALVLDASIYSLEGETLAVTEEAMPLTQVVGISTPLSVASFGRQQIVEPILSDGQPVGFIRITLEHEQLIEDANDQLDYMLNTVRGLILAAMFIGLLLALTFGRRKDIWHFPFLLSANAKD